MRLPDLDFKDLALVVAVEDTRRLTLAARHLGLSVSAVSHRLKALEDHLGTHLFVRAPEGMTATAAGRRFAAEARTGLQAAQRAADLPAAAAPVARIGSAWLMATTVLPALLSRTPAPQSEPRWDIRTGRSQDVLDWVEDGAVDVGLVRASRARPGVSIRILGVDPVELLVPSHHRWAVVRPDVAELAEEPFVVLSDRTGFGRFIREAADTLGIRTRAGAQVDSLEAALALVAAGVGPAFLPRSLVRLRRPDEVRAVMLAGAQFPLRPLAMAWRHGTSLPSWAQAWPGLVTRIIQGPDEGTGG
ncbi:MAG: LysR family transcriptional regulator [Clostridia bacterium]